MDNFYFIGVDVSKKKLDFCVLFEGKVLREEQVSHPQTDRRVEERFGNG